MDDKTVNRAIYLLLAISAVLFVIGAVVAWPT